MQLEFGDATFDYCWWTDQQLRGTAEHPVAFDLETELIATIRQPEEGESPSDVPTDPRSVPRASLGMAFDGQKLVLIHPSKFGRFISAHRSQPIVGHNLQFDWWVLHRHTDNATRELLWTLGDRNLLHDSMIMDLLLQLGTGRYRHAASSRYGEDTKLYPTNLGVLAAEWEVGELDKGDEYRLRFGELLGLSEEQISAHPEAQGFFDYALRDVVATYHVFAKQRAAGLELMKRAGWNPKAKAKYEIRPDAVEKFGVLSESLQTKASIVLAELSRTPIRIDQERRAATEAAARERYAACLEKLLTYDNDLIKRYKVKARCGETKLTSRSLLPQFNQTALVAILEAEANRIGVPKPLSDGKKRGTSTSTKTWARYAEQSPFIAAWVELEREAKLLEFLTTLNAPEVYSNYNLLMRTGRTSAGAHKRKGEMILPSVNIQQMPREDHTHPERSVRSLFLPPPGMKWFSCDYSYLELRSLAARCRALYGWSKLADAIVEHTNGGKVDPHQRTAASILGVSVEEFLQLDKDQQKRARQAAKAVNFGYPGGLGIEKFLTYSKVSYGVEFTKTAAKEAKQKWLDAYPELRLHLEDRTQQAMEWQANCAMPKLTWLQKKRLSDFLRQGEAGRKKLNFNESEEEFFWQILEVIAYGKSDEQALEDIEQRRVTATVQSLVYYRACTLTGRIRNNVKYTDNANTPFQGVAADGAKLAMWNLFRRGYRVLAFIHDAFDVAIDPRNADRQCKKIEEIMCRSMEEVLGQDVPVAAEGELAECWSKA